MRHARQRATALVRARSAAVAVVFATMLVPLCMLVGLVIDYGWALQAKSQLDLAADAAAMAAARTAAAGYAAGQTSAVYMAEGAVAANQWWASQAGTVSEAKSFAASPTVSQNGQTFTATLTYSASVYQVMPRLFGASASNVSSIANSSTASITVNAYGTIDFVLDNTSSMMLPQDDTNLAVLQTAMKSALASGSNRAALVNGVNTNANGMVGAYANGQGVYTIGSPPPASSGSSLYCAFACHWDSTSTASNPTDYYGVARQAGAKLRFDEVQSATTTGIQEMESQEKALGQLSVGLFAFGGLGMANSSYLKTIFAEAPIDTAANGTSSKNAGGTLAIAALNAITPPVSGDTPNTNVGAALKYTLAITGQGGDGSTSQKPLKSMILVTDGVEDDSNAQSIPTTEGPITSSVCSAVKTAGYTLYVLYTPYNSANIYLPFSMGLQPYITGATTPSVLSALQACASAPGDVIKATTPADVQTALQTLVDAALVGATTKITN